jgi:hypothetical protein
MQSTSVCFNFVKGFHRREGSIQLCNYQKESKTKSGKQCRTCSAHLLRWRGAPSVSCSARTSSLSFFPVHLDGSSFSTTVISSSDIPSPTFEPMINYPALSSFLLIFTVYAFLQIRIVGIENAAKRRREALQSLRNIKALQLSSSVGDERPTDEKVQSALKEYEQALIDEDRARTVLPGVRIVAPDNSASKENVAAAKQFLGTSLTSQQDKENAQSIPPEDRSFGNFVLGSITICLIALLVVLSFDPLSSSTDMFLR